MKMLLLSCALLPALALAQPMPPMPPMPPHPEGGLEQPLGIPPQVAKRLGIPDETVRKVKDLSFEANEQLIGLEADLKRAQLQLDRTLSAPSPDEGQVMGRVEAVGKAELAVRKNRIGLMLRIRKLLGAELWQKLEAESPREIEERRIVVHPGAPGESRRIIVKTRERNGEP